MVAQTQPDTEGPWHVLTARPLLLSSIGAGLLGLTGLLYRESHTSPATATTFRFLYALPLLWALAVYERRQRPTWNGSRLVAWVAGFMLAGDLVLWLRSVDDIGVGLATVLGNVQLVFVVLISAAFLGERLNPLLLLAVAAMSSGVVLIAGVFEHGAYGPHPAQGALLAVLAGILYAGYIILMRRASAGSATIRPLLNATAAGAVCATGLGLVFGQLKASPSWPSHGWLLLLALLGQALAWLLLTVPTGRLPASSTSFVLTLQPVTGLLIGAVILGERPTLLQAFGVVLLLSGFTIGVRFKQAVPPIVAKRRRPAVDTVELR